MKAIAQAHGGWVELKSRLGLRVYIYDRDSLSFVSGTIARGLKLWNFVLGSVWRVSESIIPFYSKAYP
ncbi:MAG: hypothetical protein ICV63_07470 [Coleofasciculus sp. Co-bin14]|nr:hypothetical protein [Coleofasciculus sp. Co-bin14]